MSDDVRKIRDKYNQLLDLLVVLDREKERVQKELRELDAKVYEHTKLYETNTTGGGDL